MRRYRIIFPLAAMCCTAALACAQTKWQQVSSFRFDWNGHKNVAVMLDIPSRWNDPGDFTRIRIHVPGNKEFTLINDTGWVKYDSDTASVSPKVCAWKNLIHSEYVLALQASRTNRTMLFLVGYSYASSPGSLDVLEISDAGQPRVILHQDELGLRDLRDLNSDGVAEVIGYPCLSEEFGNGLLTYDPFNVYSLARIPGGQAALSIALSKSYNSRHYYGWAGPECSEKFAVVLHPPNGGKPIVVNVKEAERITGNR